MKTKYILASLAITTLSANSATIIDSTGDNINQATFAVSSAQSFTTGILGSENILSTITLSGPQTQQAPGVTNFGISISINGGPQNTFNPTVSLGEVGPQETFGGTTFDFSSQNIVLTDNTVYLLRFTDGNGTNQANTRIGLSNGAAAGTGGSAPGAFADGTFFSNGATVFGNGFDAAIAVNTSAIPEPSSTALLGLGALAFLIRKRK